MAPPLLCKVCLDCLVNHKGLRTSTAPLAHDWYFDHHDDLQSLQRSVEAECAICTRLWTRQYSHLVFTGTAPLTYLNLTLDRGGKLGVFAKYEPHAVLPAESAWASTSSYSLRDAEDTDDEYYTRYDATDWTGSPESWALVLKWLHECIAQHGDECNPWRGTPWYPTRLIDVGSREGEPVRLIVSVDAHLKGGYVTLSHRWGDAVTCKLLRSTYSSMLQEIKVGDLPLTFQHAIEVARRLHKRYLWIDSLCIFQDSDDRSDWQTESSLMQKVYLYSWLNVSATGAEDSSKGLFQKRDPDRELKPPRLTCPKPATTAIGKTGPVPFALDDKKLLSDSLHNAPLARRAWVFQEHFLSYRVLHFGAKQLFWECHRSMLCERYPNKVPPVLIQSLDGQSLKIIPLWGYWATIPRPPVAKYRTSDESRLYLLSWWRRLVTAYSRTNITFDSDRAVAIAGVAKVMRRVSELEYVAGMWHYKLQGQLLWCVNPTHRSEAYWARRPSSYRAPTWSWLSVEGEISGGPWDWSDFRFQILDVSLTHATQDDTAAITSGSMTLKGHLRSFQLHQEQKMSLGWELRISWPVTVGGEKVSIGVSLDVLQPNFDEANQKRELFLMLGATSPMNTATKHTMHTLLLLRCTDPIAGIFERMGTASFEIDRGPDNPATWTLLQGHDQDEASFPCVSFDAASRSHTIVVK